VAGVRQVDDRKPAKTEHDAGRGVGPDAVVVGSPVAQGASHGPRELGEALGGHRLGRVEDARDPAHG
jgi:hypothetical protein